MQHCTTLFFRLAFAVVFISFWWHCSTVQSDFVEPPCHAVPLVSKLSLQVVAFIAVCSAVHYSRKSLSLHAMQRCATSCFSVSAFVALIVVIATHWIETSTLRYALGCVGRLSIECCIRCVFVLDRVRIDGALGREWRNARAA